MIFFYSSRSVFMVFHDSRSFLWFQVSLHPSWALKARSEMLTTPQKVPAWSVSLPHNPARPCRPQAGFGLVMMRRRRTMSILRMLMLWWLLRWCWCVLSSSGSIWDTGKKLFNYIREQTFKGRSVVSSEKLANHHLVQKNEKNNRNSHVVQNKMK